MTVLIALAAGAALGVISAGRHGPEPPAVVVDCRCSDLCTDALEAVNELDARVRYTLDGVLEEVEARTGDLFCVTALVARQYGGRLPGAYRWASSDPWPDCKRERW